MRYGTLLSRSSCIYDFLYAAKGRQPFTRPNSGKVLLPSAKPAVQYFFVSGLMAGVQGFTPGRGGGKGVQRVWGNIDVPPDPLALAERVSLEL